MYFFLNADFVFQRNRGKRPVTEGELIHDEIEQQVSRCQCRRQFKCTKVGEGKYKVRNRSQSTKFDPSGNRTEKNPVGNKFKGRPRSFSKSLL